jgi:hypothetical protein
MPVGFWFAIITWSGDGCANRDLPHDWPILKCKLCEKTSRLGSVPPLRQKSTFRHNPECITSRAACQTPRPEFLPNASACHRSVGQGASIIAKPM